jgi:hypothetical protein
MNFSKNLPILVILLSSQLSYSSEAAKLRPELGRLRGLDLSKEAKLERIEQVASVIDRDILTEQELKEDKLFRAIETGDVDAVRAAIAAGANIEGDAASKAASEEDSSYCGSHPLLIDAVSSGNLEMIKFLLAAGADINFLIDHDQTVLDVIEEKLSFASEYNNDYKMIPYYQETKKFLIENGAKRAEDLAAKIAPPLPHLQHFKDLALSKEAELERTEQAQVVGIRNPRILDVD